ncbi:hypothetical protein FA15DRAFT_663871 [Coprinopsis marcescibilis]|uniref:F-box domain-containing protein n=1 Tax=Coprinopsis marcescibilis TaxID=230819 RepID=A0A5C3LBC5_COPMA|nr:hypothetical protein FA15DRAFT_663871 [Coprinopsis marcescibilis]
MVSSTGGTPDPGLSQPEEPEELARFRNEWRAEVQRKKALEGHGKGKEPETQLQADSELKPANLSASINRPPPRIANTATSSAAQPVERHPVIVDGDMAAVVTASGRLKNALDIYKQAIFHEQKGELDSALVRYRQAFRLDPNVDRAYHLAELWQSKHKAHREDSELQTVIMQSTDLPGLASGLQKLALKTTTGDGKTLGVTGSLAKLVSEFPSDLLFEPEDEKQPVHINILPPELLYDILRKLDVSSLERFARVSRRARVLALDPVYWSNLVTATYRPPQITSLDDLLPVIEKYESDFRRVYIAQPRLRMDGIYIATCHYIRPGMGEDAWMSRTHLITYHRYLRFYPNGRVLSLLANDHISPQEVIPLLKPTLRMSGFFIGSWSLTGTTVNIVNLLDASGKFMMLVDNLEPLHFRIPERVPSEPSISGPSNPGSTAAIQPKLTFTGGSTGPSKHRHQAAALNAEPLPQPRYIFDMTLELRSKPLGRWNKLEMATYDSINLETGDVCPLPLKNERPYWFSKVKSYAN